MFGPITFDKNIEQKRKLHLGDAFTKAGGVWGSIRELDMTWSLINE